MTNTNFKRILLDSAKLGAAGASIALIAWCFVTFSTPTGEVETAQADILDNGFFAPPTKQQAFVNTLKDFGMEKPRSYNWNGNTVFFSMGYSKAAPEEILGAFQREFVRKGVNKRVHQSIMPRVPLVTSGEQVNAMSTSERRDSTHQLTSRLSQLDDFFSGGLVPVVIDRNYIAMAGTTSKQEAPDALSFLQEQIQNKSPVAEGIKNMRFIEARRAPGEKRTMISAIWSDDKLDSLKFEPDAKRSDLAVSTKAPACLGCRRIMSFHGEGKERDYGTNVFVGQQSVPEVIAFYDRALATRGWQRSDASRVMRQLSNRGIIPPSAASMTSYSKGNQFTTVMAYPIDHGARTQVHVFDSP